jgi:drug/metabolite transporter (DMT)-like permease
VSLEDAAALRAPAAGSGRWTLTHGRAVAVMVAVTMMWSIAGVVTRQLEQARSFEVTFWRSLFTAVFLSAIVGALQGRTVWSKVRAAGPALWFSGLCWSVMFTAFMLALTLTTVANVLVTMAAGPFVTAIVARIFIGQRIPPRTWAAIFAAGLGIGSMYATQLTSGGLTGTLVAFCVPLAAAANWTITQRSHLRGEDVDFIPAVLVGAVLSSLATLPLALPFTASCHDVAWLALLGLVQLAIPCALSVACARVLAPPEIALLALLEVIFGILLAWLGAGETPGTAVLAGGALVIGALALNELAGWRQRA